ncbi:ABC transporter [Phlyctema vagabunda]|uniref:ABC transporter n=1 Tax=Phlyctema vagabunda TaxID=108571 RepID=A0ABR4PAS2_9HELO
MNTCYFITFANQCWLSIRLNLIGNVLMLITTLLVTTNNANLNPSLSAVILNYVLQVVYQMQFLVKQLAQVENSMNSAERIIYYGNQLPSEIEPAANVLLKPAPSWPEKGEIRFENVQMRYRDGLPLVLKGLNLDVRGGERIGIVGRTGAGKSSIISSLFRMVELSSGKIEIDGNDISKIGLHGLRSSLSIIPQDPTLFRGTVRSNLDPFNEHSDLELWAALKSAHLIGESSTEPEAPQEAHDATGSGSEQNQTPSKLTLETPIVSEGLNFSLGQRQLMALARALIRKSRIIVCDEATSSIDEEMDRKIQTTILEGFKGSTVLCIAHRLRTILNYDKVVVMDAGIVVEFDEPLKLWNTQGGVFRAICDKSKIRRGDFDP